MEVTHVPERERERVETAFIICIYSVINFKNALQTKMTLVQVVPRLLPVG